MTTCCVVVLPSRGMYLCKTFHGIVATVDAVVHAQLMWFCRVLYVCVRVRALTMWVPTAANSAAQHLSSIKQST